MKGWKAKLRREIARDQRARDRETLRALRERIRALRARRREALKVIRLDCRAERARVREQAQQLRQEARERLNATLANLRAAQRDGCALRTAEARRELGEQLSEAVRELRGEKLHQRLVAEAEGRLRKRDARTSSRRERQAESDDEVRANLPSDLVPVFDARARHIKARPRMSRTETFLHWAEEHPDEVYRIMAEQADRKLAELERAERAMHAKLRKVRAPRRAPSDEELAELLAGVPF